ncbi:hypothetical protein [Acutalibacter caecimuris]|uniref:hypothetical protein n=1 Tax=Acutalibacter caecimuris TaxID=3093657 RepID=UPI002AC917E1|nr:hypothetical protein [Acutalibacter sp. M00118]
MQFFLRLFSLTRLGLHGIITVIAWLCRQDAGIQQNIIVLSGKMALHARVCFKTGEMPDFCPKNEGFQGKTARKACRQKGLLPFEDF